MTVTIDNELIDRVELKNSADFDLIIIVYYKNGRVRMFYL